MCAESRIAKHGLNIMPLRNLFSQFIAKIVQIIELSKFSAMFFVFAAAFVVKSAVLTASLVTFQHPVHPIRHKYGA